MKPIDIFDYILLALIWGLSFLLVLHVSSAFGWIGAVTFRAFVAGGVLFALAGAQRQHLDFSAGWLPFAIVGATTVVGQLIGMSYATPRIGTAMAAILVAAIPLFSMVIGHLGGHEPITGQGLAGLGLGVGGIVVLVGFPAVAITGEFLLGCASSLFGSFCAAVGSVYASRRLRHTRSLEVTIGAFLSGGLMSLPLLLVVPVPGTPQPVDFIYLVALGSIMSALAYVRYFRLVASIGPTRAVSVEFAVTVVAVVVGTAFLRESLTAAQVAGAAAIITGCLLVLGLIRVPTKRASRA